MYHEQYIYQHFVKIQHLLRLFKGKRHMNIFSDKVKDLQGSAIREAFKALQRPGMISFAGGIPSPTLYPHDELGALAAEILKDDYVPAMNYGITEGYAPLQAQVRERLAPRGIVRDNDEVLITAGGQQGISLAAHVLLNEGSIVAVESPSFIGGLNAYRALGAKLLPIPMQPDGIDTDALAVAAQQHDIRLLYVIPNFQNPSGITMSLPKRKALLEQAERHNFYIIEDDPYGELRFEGEPLPTLKSMDTAGRVIYVGSFSKVLAPGLRVGFAVCDKAIADKMTVVKQVADVHTTVLPQMMVSRFLQRYDLDALIEKERALYKQKSSLMISLIDRHFPSHVTHTNPQGGIFLWCDMGSGDSAALTLKALDHNVAIIRGSSCMTDPSATYSTFRLNYSTPSDEQIETGITILGKLLSER